MEPFRSARGPRKPRPDQSGNSRRQLRDAVPREQRAHDHAAHHSGLRKAIERHPQRTELQIFLWHKHGRSVHPPSSIKSPGRLSRGQVYRGVGERCQRFERPGSQNSRAASISHAYQQSGLILGRAAAFPLGDVGGRSIRERRIPAENQS